MKYKNQAGYILDSSIFVSIIRNQFKEIKEAGKQLMQGHIHQDMLISSIKVYEENHDVKKEKSGDELLMYLKHLKEIKVMQAIEPLDEQNVVKILKKFPNLLKDPQTNKENADPWLIALAMRNSGWIIISEDKNLKAVCKDCNLPIMSDYEYLKLNKKVFK